MNNRNATYNVSVMMTEDDNGICLSYKEKLRRDSEAKRLRAEGAYCVQTWQT